MGKYLGTSTNFQQVFETHYVKYWWMWRIIHLLFIVQSSIHFIGLLLELEGPSNQNSWLYLHAPHL